MTTAPAHTALVPAPSLVALLPVSDAETTLQQASHTTPTDHVAQLTPEQAAEVTAAAQHALTTMEALAAHFRVLITRAWDGKAHRALGYPTWQAYCDDAFGVLGTLRIDTALRQALIAEMHERVVPVGGKRMSVRAIADAWQIADQTARADLVKVKAARRAAEAAVVAAEQPAAPAVEDDVVVGTVVEPTRGQQVLTELRERGATGGTSAELERRFPRWTPGVWSELSRLHARGLVQRLSRECPDGVREGRLVYVVPECVQGRPVEGMGQGVRRRKTPPAGE